MLADYPYLADVARLERLWLDAFHEADAPVLTPETLGTLPAGELFEARFKAHPATRLMASSFAAVSIFAASREGRDLSGIALARPEWALVTRPAFAVDVRMLDLGAFVFLEALVGGRTLGDATSSAAEVDQNFDLPTALGLMLTSGAFTSIKQETSP